MLSITEIKKRLPKDFIENLYENYNPLIVDKILIGMKEERFTTLRVNTIKYNIQDLMKYFKQINIKFERIPWYTDGLIIKNASEKDIMKLDIFKKRSNIFTKHIKHGTSIYIKSKTKRQSTRPNSSTTEAKQHK